MVPRVGSDHRFRAPPAYTAQLLSLHQHRAHNQYRTWLIKSSRHYGLAAAYRQAAAPLKMLYAWRKKRLHSSKTKKWFFFSCPKFDPCLKKSWPLKNCHGGRKIFGINDLCLFEFWEYENSDNFSDCFCVWLDSWLFGIMSKILLPSEWPLRSVLEVSRLRIPLCRLCPRIQSLLCPEVMCESVQEVRITYREVWISKIALTTCRRSVWGK